MSTETAKLLKQYAEVINKLRTKGVIRSKNNPAGDYAESLAMKAFSLSPCPKSQKGYDAFDEDYRYEVKARRITEDNGSRQLSAIRKIDENHFDYVIAILFQWDFTIYRAAKIPHRIVKEHARHKAHTNAAIFILSDSVWGIEGVEDVTAVIRAAAELV